MTRKMKLAIGTMTAVVMMAVAATVAFSSTSPAPFKTWFTTVSLVKAHVASYDFGYDSVAGHWIGNQPAIVQIHTFNLHRGAAIPWHYHKAVSYVAIQGGTVTEQHLNSDGTCSSPERFSAGGGFTEPQEYVHTVVNVGNTDALISWATAYPASDVPLRISPQFTVGGLYPVPEPTSCK